MADTQRDLEQATSRLMTLINEAATQRRVSQEHMHDPDNFTYAKATRDADARAIAAVIPAIKACESHQREVIRQARTAEDNSPKV